MRKKIGWLFVLLPLGAICVISAGCSPSKAQAGPNGGDVVPIQNGAAKAELVTNSETGEAMVHTWDNNLKAPFPIESAPLVIGNGDRGVELMPHPSPSDPAGRCSQFYGQADWMRGGGFHDGWMRMGGGGTQQNFAWAHCWDAGRSHGAMWEQMGEHRRMGPGMGPGMGPRGGGHQ